MSRKTFHSSYYYAFRIAFIYLALVSVWCFFSGRILENCAGNDRLYSIAGLFKDWLFVAATAVFLFVERRISFQKFLRAESRIENYFLYSMDGIVMTDPDGKIAVWNPAMERIFGIPPKNAIGKSIWEVKGIFVLKDISGRDGESLAKRMLSSGSPVVLRGSDDYLLSDNVVVHVSQTLFTIPDNRAFLIGGFYRDETVNKKNERDRETIIHIKDMLIREIHHRIKNNLQMMTSLLHLQECSAKEESVKKVLAESRSRIRSMAMIHDCLYKTGDYSFIQLDDYVRRLISGISGTYNFEGKRVVFVTDIEDILMKASSAVPCALLLNELFTNIYKHAAQSGGEVEVQVIIRHIHDICYIQVRDNGPGLPSEFKIGESKSLGLGLIYSLSEQLGGEPVFRSDGGLIFELRFPDDGIVSGKKNELEPSASIS